MLNALLLSFVETCQILLSRLWVVNDFFDLFGLSSFRRGRHGSILVRRVQKHLRNFSKLEMIARKLA